MTDEARILLAVIVDYLDSANSAHVILSEYLDGNPYELWKRRLVPQKGGGHGWRYFFHGVGCKVETTDLNVDFDYSSDGTIRTFDEWVLRKYWNLSNSMISDREFSESYAELVNSQMISARPMGLGGRIHVLTSKWISFGH